MFEPWIGDNYYSTTEIPRTLILGESHYGNPHIQGGYDIRKTTILCIEDRIIRNMPYRFFTNIVTSFIGHRPNFAETKEFWHRVAYHNLITTPLAASRRAPTYTQWQESLPTLPAIVESLKPDYVVVLGYRMWRQLASLPSIRNVPEVKDVGPCGVRIFGTSYFHGIMHPSGGYSPLQWHAVIQSAKKQLWPNAHNEPNT
jgi:hypothetical protein